jgi:hypothetical protein
MLSFLAASQGLLLNLVGTAKVSVGIPKESIMASLYWYQVLIF